MAAKQTVTFDSKSLGTLFSCQGFDQEGQTTVICSSLEGQEASSLLSAFQSCHRVDLDWKRFEDNQSWRGSASIQCLHMFGNEDGFES